MNWMWLTFTAILCATALGFGYLERRYPKSGDKK